MLLNFIKPTANPLIHFSKIELISELKKLFIDKILKNIDKMQNSDFFVSFLP